MSRKSSLFSSRQSSESEPKISEKEGVEIALEMAPGEPLRFTKEMLMEHTIQSE